MTDYGHELEFGLFPTPDSSRHDDLLGLVQTAEVTGLDIVSMQDHPYQRRFMDTWTLLSVIGARTSTIKVATNVASLPLRPPVVLAKSAATLDVLTGGRVELGLGAGAFWDAIEAAGGPRRTPGEAVDALREAISIIRAFWGGRSVRFDGEHYSASGLQPGPVPAHDIPIALGAYKPRMLRLTAELADAWVPSMGYADPPDLPKLIETLDHAATQAGRGPETIRRMYNIFGQFGSGGGFLKGSARDWAEQLAELALGTGMSTFILGSDDPDDVRRFADEVAPATREIVTRERGRAQQRAEQQPAEKQLADQSMAQPMSQQTGQGKAGLSSATESPAGSGPAPTPDDGTRLTGELSWDEPSRPTYDSGAGEARDPHTGAAQHLVDIHDGLRSELTQVRQVLDQVRTGHTTVGAARSVINTMTMRQNNWTLGAYCAAYCRVVTGHHTLEDRGIFPHLRRSEPGLDDVIQRLEHEHEVIHGVLESFDHALVDLVGSEGTGQEGSDALERVQRELDMLTDTMLSHLAYEERELLGPISRHGLN